MVIRSTVPLERDHGADRRAVRHRTGRENTGEEMGRLGSLLAFWANMRCPWFRDHVLPGVNLWEVFVEQDSEEVQRRILALPRCRKSFNFRPFFVANFRPLSGLRDLVHHLLFTVHVHTLFTLSVLHLKRTGGSLPPLPSAEISTGSFLLGCSLWSSGVGSGPA